MYSRLAAEKIIAPYEDAIKNSVYNGWDDFWHDYREIKHIFKKRTRSSMVNDYIVKHAHLQLGCLGEVRVIETKGITLFNIEDEYIVRFKLLDNKKMYKNVKTVHTLEFYKQNNLPNIPSAVRLVAGYELNHLGTLVKSISMTCPNGQYNHWYWSLTGPNQLGLFDRKTDQNAYDTSQQIIINPTKEERRKNEKKC